MDQDIMEEMKSQIDNGMVAAEYMMQKMIDGNFATLQSTFIKKFISALEAEGFNRKEAIALAAASISGGGKK